MKRSTPRLSAFILSISVLIFSTPYESFSPLLVFGDERPNAPSTSEKNGENSKLAENSPREFNDSTAPLQKEPVLFDADVSKRTDDAPTSIKPRRRVTLRPETAEAAPSEDVEPQTFVGREIADYRTEDGGGNFILEDLLGEIRVFENAQIESVEPASEIDAQELRSLIVNQLETEFGAGFKTKSTERYLFIYNVSEGYVEWCAQLFESLVDGFEKFAEKYDLETTNRDEPLIVVVFATRQEFNQYAKRDQISDPNRVAAYYNMQTNRVVLCDLSGVEGSREEPSRRLRSYREIREILSRPNAAFNVATIVHEATHQIAFNRGVFLRTGPFPLWAVEGLSLVFETPNGKTSQGGWGYRGSFPTNERQLASFWNFAARSTTGDPIRDLIRQDKFMQDVQGSYATSWALFYYLYKKKPKDLVRYLQKISSKPPYLRYSPEERVADFEEFFGDDWEKTYKNLLRFVRAL